jgi:hypothetical protein
MINRGHSDNSSVDLEVTDVDDGYNGTGNSEIQAAGLGWEQKRTHELSNGQIIWDLSGNLWEWIDPTLGGVASFIDTNNKAYDADDGGPIGSYRDFNLLDVNVTLANDFYPDFFSPSDSSLTKSHGIGAYYSGSNGVGGSMARGGRYNGATNAGIYTIYANVAPTAADGLIGYRCVFRL